MLKCAISADFLGKTHGFLAFLLKFIHYVIGLNTSLSYIRMVIEEKIC